MANIKTAISIDKPLFEQVDELAHELNTSRSRIFALAATEFSQRHKNLKLLEAINAAYDDFPDVREASLKCYYHFSNFHSKQKRFIRKNRFFNA